MRGYSYTHVFNVGEIGLRALAEKCVEAIPEDNESALRCHEIARAVGRVLGLDHQDGYYCAVDHTWLIVPDLRLGGGRCILDVYAVGRLPMVQLVEVQSPGLGHRALYEAGELRGDIRNETIDRLVFLMREALR